MDPAFIHAPEALARLPQPEDDPFLVLHYTERCNASCAHCVVESGPERKGTMDAALARAVIEGAAARPEVRLAVFTGGESFLHLPEILELCRCARGHGLKTRIITNGYWATTPERAAEMLERLAADAVDQLAVSFDSYHLPYVPAERVVNIVRGAALASASPYLVYTTVIPNAQDEVPAQNGFHFPRAVLAVLELYGFPVERCVPRQLAHAQLALIDDEASRRTFKRRMIHERAMISWETLALAGRAAREMRPLSLRPLPAEPEPCVIAGSQITVPSNGHLFPCCSAWSNHPRHSFGVVGSDGDFASLHARMEDDPLVGFIRDFGPGELVRFVREREGGWPDRYADICQMCESLLTRLGPDELRAAVAAYHSERPWAQLMHECSSW